jgi:hypothetical protein
MRQMLFFLPMVVGALVVLCAARPLHYNLSFGKVLLVAVLLRAAEVGLEALLAPMIGDWKFLADFVGYALVAAATLSLSAGRSVTFAAVYFVALALMYFSVGLLHHYHVLVV